MKKVVVFGGSGFLGSHVSDILAERGYEVIIYDLEESPHIGKNQKIVVGNILDEEKVNSVLKDVDFVYNFSGMADLDECSQNPTECIKHNILGHTTVLDKCRKNQVKRVIFASSVYVYGKHGSFYRITKQTCEQLTEEYMEKYGLNYTVLRYGSLYGPRAQMWNSVYRYIHQAIKEGKIDYPGTGDEKREYIHVFDAANLSVDILDEKYKNRHVVITGNTLLTPKDLMSMINEMLESKVTINFADKKLYHHYNITPYSFVPKLGVKLTPNPSIDMGEGILRQIENIYKEVKNKTYDPVT